MRKLTGAVFISIDGVMQAPGGPEEDPTSDFRLGGWVQPHWSDSPFDEVIMGEYDLLLGKRTYDIFAAYWPYNQDNPIGEKFQRIDKYVLTHSDEPLRWENSHRIGGDTAEAVALLKQTEGRDLLIQGSSTLYPPLLSSRLIDRLIWIHFADWRFVHFTIPAVLGPASPLVGRVWSLTFECAIFLLARGGFTVRRPFVLFELRHTIPQVHDMSAAIR